MTRALRIAAAASLLAAAGPAAAEGLTVSEIVLGQTRSMLVLPERAAPVFENARERIVVDKRNRRLFFRVRTDDGAERVRLYRVGIGRPEAHLPLGRTRVTGKRADPSWWPTPRARRRDPFLPAMVEAGGDNPLGSRAINLAWKYYLIHGTNDARKIGRGATWGCVSLYESEVHDFFDRVDSGTRARLEPVVEHGVGHGFVARDPDGDRGGAGDT
jgi:lipoprotein-anchoring transpeptidase ErfK/SrfK